MGADLRDIDRFLPGVAVVLDEFEHGRYAFVVHPDQQGDVARTQKSARAADLGEPKIVVDQRIGKMPDISLVDDSNEEFHGAPPVHCVFVTP